MKIKQIATLATILLVMTLPGVQALQLFLETQPARDITETSVIVKWRSDTAATSKVEYGTTRTLGEQKEDNTLKTTHEIQLDGLQPRTRYFFKIISQDTQGNQKTADLNGNLYSFSTSSQDSTPPRIIDLRLAETTNTQATITWKTSEEATAKIYYGITQVLAEETTSSQRGTEHTVTIQTVPDRTYFFVANSCDSLDNCANSTVQNFRAGQPLTEFAINATVPAVVNTNSVSIFGRTVPFAHVEVFVNNNRVRVQDTGADGVFFLRNVPLSAQTNTLAIEATNQNGDKTKREYNVAVDTRPPILTFTKPLPAVTTEPTLSLQGSTTEPLTIRYRTTLKTDTEAPERITGLKKGRVTENSVELEWDASTAIDLLEYAVYRDGIRLAATPNPAFIDTSASTGTRYSYQVSTVDQSCNEGEQSNEATVTTQTGGIVQENPEQAQLTCEEPFTEVLAQNTFTLPINLQEGRNFIELYSRDSAGNEFTVKNITQLDTQEPQFEETNLDSLNPSYVPEVEVKGKLSEPGVVKAFLGDKEIKRTVTEPDGSFEIPITLERVNPVQFQTSSGLESDRGFQNDISLEATDFAGHKTRLDKVPIVLAQCGFGAWFDVNIGTPTPDALTPRLLLQGIQQAGVPFNISYRGRHNITINNIRVGAIEINPALAKEYDHDKASINSLFRLAGPKSAVGFVQVNFNTFDPLGDKKELSLFAREKAVSEHRLQTKEAPKPRTATKPIPTLAPPKNCLIPGVGCMRFYLELEIAFQEIRPPVRRADPRTQQFLDAPQVENLVQKACILKEIPIDQRIPPDVIPEGFLKSSVRFLTDVIDLIDQVLDPVTTIGTYVFYTCTAFTVWQFWDFIAEKWYCDASQVVEDFDKIMGKEGSWDKSIAEIGMCEQVYAGTEQKNKEAKDKCMSCQNALKRIKEMDDIVNPICDRVGCPSAPTWQTHIKDMFGSADLVIKDGPILVKPEVKGWVFGEKENRGLYSGSDCAFLNTGTNQNTPGIITGTDYKTLRKLYDFTVGKGTSPYGEIKLEDCKKTLHPAHPACCGIEYQKQWASACGVPSLGVPSPIPFTGAGSIGTSFLDTFDELQESVCLGAQNANQKVFAKDLQCGGVFNAAAGFCEPKTAGPTVEPIATGLKFSPGNEPAGARSNEVYLLLVPETDPRKEQVRYYVYRGYVVDRFVKDKTEKEKGITTISKRGLGSGVVREWEVNAKTNVISDGTDLTSVFDDRKSRDTAVKELQAKINSKNDLSRGLELPRAQEIYDFIKSKIGTPEQEYIVVPESGLLRSAQCVCFPAFISHLSLYRNVAAAVRNCFAAILGTGDGSPGACQAMLSTHVCDLLFELITCFTQKFSIGGGARAKLGPVGDFVGALTGAGTEMSRRVQRRYGESSLFKAMFTEKKLQHAICQFAFTGTWDLDMSTLFKESIDKTPIESQGLLYPCERRFVTYDPTTRPAGLTTQTYRFGIGLAAGADLRYRLELMCSQGFNCDTTTHKNGECDCNKKGEQRTVINPEGLGTGQLKKNDILSTEVFHTVQAGDPDSDVRYDKAVLSWEYEDPRTNKVTTGQTEPCRITQLGTVPNECVFDPFSLMFRCRFGAEQKGIRINSVDPVYPKEYEKARSAFALDTPIVINLDISQEMPEQFENRRGRLGEAKKHLEVKLLNSQGKPIDQHSKEDTLDKSGDYIKEIPLGTINKGELEKATIKGLNIVQKNYPEGGSASSGSYVLELTPTEDRHKGKTTAFVIVFEEQRNMNKFQILKLSSESDTGVDTAGHIANGNFGGKDEIEITFFDTVPVGTTHESIQYRMKLKKPSPLTTPGQYKISVRYQKSKEAETKPCDLKEGKYPTVELPVEVTVYESGKFGEKLPQIAIDPATGELQQKKVTVRFVCQNKADLETEAAAKVGEKKDGGGESAARGIVEPVISASATSISEDEIQVDTYWHTVRGGGYLFTVKKYDSRTGVVEYSVYDSTSKTTQEGSKTKSEFVRLLNGLGARKVGPGTESVPAVPSAPPTPTA